MTARLLAILLVLFTFSYTASAHNQDPSTIRKTLKTAFEKFEASLPKDYIKSTQTFNVSGKTVEYYAVREPNGKTKAVIGKVEVQEVLYAIGVDVLSGKVLVVSMRGKSLNEEELKTLDFVEPVSKGLLEYLKQARE